MITSLNAGNYFDIPIALHDESLRKIRDTINMDKES